MSKAVFRKPLFFRPRSHGLVAINSRDASGRSFQPIAGRRVNEDDSDRIGLALCVPLRYRPASFKMCLFTLAGSDSNRLIFTPSIANEAFTVVINNTPSPLATKGACMSGIFGKANLEGRSLSLCRTASALEPMVKMLGYPSTR